MDESPTAPALCTTSGEPVAVVRANQTEETGQHKSYIVLCPDARDPHFYNATFCVSCNKHLPVAEFVWTADGLPVGS